MNKNLKKIIKIGIFIGTIATIMHLINRYIEKAANLLDKLKEKDPHYFHWKLGNVYYEKAGEGKPLLLIHDFTPYASSYEWNCLINKLSESHTVYTIDLLGCGRSDKPAIEYTNFMYVQLINDFINEVIGEKTDLITSGYSSSIGIMSTNYTCEYIDKLLLINPGDMNVITRKPCIGCKILKKIIELPILGTFLYNMFTLQANIDHILIEKYFYNPFQVHTDIIDTYYKSAHTGHAHGKYIFSSIIGNYNSANMKHLLPSCTNSIYIIGGQYQENIEKNIADYKEMKEDIKSDIIPKTKKLPHIEMPEEVLLKISEYID